MQINNSPLQKILLVNLYEFNNLRKLPNIIKIDQLLKNVENSEKFLKSSFYLT